jgi:sterol desaturase/sphingolipid hydroxylase (fatty acid hydroxylase superfamily)
MSTLEATLLFLAVALVVALAEYQWRQSRGHGYSFGSLGANLGIMLGQGVAKALTTGFVTAAYMLIYAVAPWQWSISDPWTWVAGFFVLEFFYYWQHRFGHTIRWFWAAHSVHHSTNEFTLPAAFRLSWFSGLAGNWILLAPVVLLGFHPLIVAALQLVNLRYQYFLHTEAVGKLGPLEWVFNTPSHHRVHHGSNPEYLDTNYGGVLIVFDRLFGTYVEERADNPVVYGLTKKLETNNPITINLYEWGNLFRDASRARTPGELWRAVFGRPSDIVPRDEAAPVRFGVVDQQGSRTAS